jgi:hypothetical protein
MSPGHLIAWLAAELYAIRAAGPGPDLAGVARRLAQHKRNVPEGWSDHD